MPDIIDSFVVALGLDDSAFRKGQKSASDAFKKTKEEAAATGKDIEASAGQAANALETIARKAAFMFAIFAGARSIEDFVSSITKADAALGRFARSINSTPQIVSAVESAVERSGGTAQEAASSFRTLSDNIQELKSNSESSLLPTLYKLMSVSKRHIDLNKSLSATFDDIAEAVGAAAQKDPALANYYARQITGSETIANMMMGGGAAWRAALAESQRHGLVTKADTDSAERLLKAWVGIHQAVTTLGRNIVTQVSPAVTGIINRMTAWIDKNRDWIADKIEEKIQQFSDAMNGVPWDKVADGLSEIVDDIKTLATNFDKVAKSLTGQDGLTLALEAFALSLTLKVLGPIARLVRLVTTLGALGLPPWLKIMLGLGAANAALAAPYVAEHGITSIDPATGQPLDANPMGALGPRPGEEGSIHRMWRTRPKWMGGAGSDGRAPGTHRPPSRSPASGSDATHVPATGPLGALGNNRFATKENANAIVSAAKELGTTPEDLATVIGYETGGSYDPSKWGGAGGNYLGLIQFGPSERTKYGISQNQTFTDQMQGVVSYLKDRGYKPGMGLADLYSTINAGSPGHYGANDGHGTVLDHVARMQRERASTARAFVGLTGSQNAANQSPWGGLFDSRSVVNTPQGAMTPAQIPSWALSPNVQQTRSSINSSRSSSINNDTRIGTVNVHTSATDAKGIASGLGDALRRDTLIAHANTGLA